jgi:hypothetical protein
MAVSLSLYSRHILLLLPPKVLSAARNAALVLFCATVLGEDVTIGQGVCYFFTLIGFLVYSYYK